MTDGEVPVWRLNLLRAFYLLITASMASTFGLAMLEHTDLWALRKGETAALLSGLAIFCLWGLRYPLQMLPLLIFALIWKTVWLVAIYDPLWRNGALTPNAEETAFACLVGVVLTPLVLPWRYLAHHYFTKSGSHWR